MPTYPLGRGAGLDTIFAHCSEQASDPTVTETPCLLLASGGVDSCAAAVLLRREGYLPTLVTLLLLPGDTPEGPGPGRARRAAERLDLPHRILDLREPFAREVVAPFREAYLRGRTPNPCADCNGRIKFHAALAVAETLLGADVPVATGHYARILREGGRATLARGRDGKRDQSYFLAGLPSSLLSRLLFPLGDLSKEDARRLAREAGLEAAETPDSMELCFVPGGDYRKLLGPEAFREGPVVDPSGRVLGTHEGVGNFTRGQRKGLGVSSPEPLYVREVDGGRNTVTVDRREALLTHLVRGGDVNVLIPEALRGKTKLFGKVRSQGEPGSCSLESWDGAFLTVRFHQPQFAPAPGQRLVLYDGQGRVVAGSTLELLMPL